MAGGHVTQNSQRLHIGQNAGSALPLTLRCSMWWQAWHCQAGPEDTEVGKPQAAHEKAGTVTAGGAEQCKAPATAALSN